MPKDPFFYVNGMDETLDDALLKMKQYNRHYLRDMGTIIKAEKGLLSRENLDRYSPKQLQKMVQQRIRAKGLTDPLHGGKLPILCKDGKLRYYKPDVWSETMARTRSRALQEEGLHNQMINAGFDLVQVSIGGSGDPCTNWEGSILSITGKTPGYPTVDEAQGSGEIFHPRCVHSTSPFILTEDENGPQVWGRDDLTRRAQEQLKNAGVTRKGTIRTGLRVLMGNKAKKTVVNMTSTNLSKNHTEAMKKAGKYADHVYFSKTMPLDQIDDAIFALDDSIKRFPIDDKDNKLTFFGLKDQAKKLTGMRIPSMGKYTNAMYIGYGSGKDMIVFRKQMLKKATNKVLDSRYHLTSKKLLAVNPNISKDVLKIIEKNGKFRAWSISTTYGTKATIYHEYGHRLLHKHPAKDKLREILSKTYKEGWHYTLSEYARTNLHEYCAEAFSAYMNGLTHLLSPDLISWFTKYDL